MTRFTIDAATLLHMVTEDVEVLPEHQLVAPQGVRSQALQLLLDGVRVGALTEAEARESHTRLTEMKIRVLGDRMSRWTSFKIAREQSWDSISAAEYIAVTKLRADALITVDEQLAGLATGLVPLAPVSALSSNEQSST